MAIFYTLYLLYRIVLQSVILTLPIIILDNTIGFIKKLGFISHNGYRTIVFCKFCFLLCDQINFTELLPKNESVMIIIVNSIIRISIIKTALYLKQHRIFG